MLTCLFLPPFCTQHLGELRGDLQRNVVSLYVYIPDNRFPIPPPRMGSLSDWRSCSRAKPLFYFICFVGAGQQASRVPGKSKATIFPSLFPLPAGTRKTMGHFGRENGEGYRSESHTQAGTGKNRLCNLSRPPLPPPPTPSALAPTRLSFTHVCECQCFGGKVEGRGPRAGHLGFAVLWSSSKTYFQLKKLSPVNFV